MKWPSFIKNGEGALNLLEVYKRCFEITLDEDVVASVEAIKSKFSGAFRNLTNLQKQDYLRILGFNGSGYNPGSYLERVYTTLTDSEKKGSNEFIKIFNSLKANVNQGMYATHGMIYQYILMITTEKELM
ncbi:hypothetical protein SCLARK_001664 [Spiroplasma clarkii]|uniref:hypothetical protein n=1 Tax=Spiroplasma clarkii TaxID=2139 RepID=UPI000B57F5D9|nr:hypothetical protein [Spiroplasma clarkii]ARU92132.1 hypothetical protein SCLARK_001664 [Spiroplasma clarkii]